MQIWIFDRIKSAQAMVALRKCSSHNGHFAHTHSISQPNSMMCNLVSTTHKECWGELAGQENALGSSGECQEPAALKEEG